MHVVVETVPLGELERAEHAPSLEPQEVERPTQVRHLKRQVHVPDARLAVADLRKDELRDLADGGKPRLALRDLLGRQPREKAAHESLVRHEKDELGQRSANVNAKKVSDVEQLL